MDVQEIIRFNENSERRRRTRFEMRVPVRCHVDGESFTGELLNISSSGALFTTNHGLAPAEEVELVIGWPVRLQESVPLNLVVEGRVVRLDDGKAAVRIERHEFRTARSSQALPKVEVLQPRDSPRNGLRLIRRTGP